MNLKDRMRAIANGMSGPFTEELLPMVKNDLKKDRVIVEVNRRKFKGIKLGKSIRHHIE